VTVIPGNHDTYVAQAVRAGTFERVFASYQTADLREGNATYPFVRLRGDVALVAVNSSVPTGDFGALGRTGADLVLHGHDHRDERATLEGPKGTKIPVVGAGSASYAAAARYNVYEIDGRAITRVTFGHDGQAFRELEREPLGVATSTAPAPP
jgi:3',5'-cyclic AMP phosphodiesterase CpdA